MRIVEDKCNVHSVPDRDIHDSEDMETKNALVDIDLFRCFRSESNEIC